MPEKVKQPLQTFDPIARLKLRLEVEAADGPERDRLLRHFGAAPAPVKSKQPTTPAPPHLPPRGAPARPPSGAGTELANLVRDWRLLVDMGAWLDRHGEWDAEPERAEAYAGRMRRWLARAIELDGRRETYRRRTGLSHAALLQLLESYDEAE